MVWIYIDIDTLVIWFSANGCYFYIFTDLMDVRNRNVDDLSGGELQRFAIAMMCIQKGDMFVLCY